MRPDVLGQNSDDQDNANYYQNRYQEIAVVSLFFRINLWLHKFVAFL